jgi:uncharacterized protein (TIGR03435 family)
MTIRSSAIHSPMVSSALTFLLIVTPPGARTSNQQQSQPHAIEFEAASIKENQREVPWQDNRDNCGLNGMGTVNILPGGRLRAQRALLACIIQGAYVIRPFQLAGGPSWVNSIHFDIDAKTTNDATPQEMRVLLEMLLTDRFRLKLHRETRNIPGYLLSIAKGGAKLKRPIPGSCLKAGASPTKELPSAPAAGQPPQPLLFRCGAMGGAGSPAGSRMDGGEVPITELVRLLTLQLKRPVIDETSLTGIFDIHLTYLGTNALSTSSTDSADSPADFGLTIFAALEKQLGLRLESSMVPTEVLVIDSVQRPNQN